MKRITSSLVFIFLVSASFMQARKVSLCKVSYPAKFPQLDTFTLKNGLKIYLLKYGKDSVLNVRLVINGGKKNETSCQVGYSEIIQQLLKETLKEKQNSNLKKKNRLACEIIEGQTLLSGNCSNSYFTKEMEIMSSAILKLRFKQNKMDGIVSSIVDSYKPENIRSHRVSAIFKDLLLYGSGNPLGRIYCQYQVEKVLPLELREFYFKNYTPKTSSLLICGNFNKEEIEKIITRYFSRWKSLRKEENVADDNELRTPKIKNRQIVFINKRDAKDYLVKWIQLAPSFKAADYPVFLLTCDLFNRYLKGKIKEKECVNDDSLSPVAIEFKPIFYTNGLMEIDCIASQNELTSVIQLVDTSLQLFHKLKFTKADLEESVKNLNDKYLKNKTAETILSFYNPILYNSDSRKNYTSNLSGITVPDIQLILKKYFNPNAYKLIIVGKENAASNSLVLKKHITKYQASDFQTCDETCVPRKERWKSHSESPRLFCRNCWKLGRFWGKNRS